ncbi:hypothetical protein M758_11G126200 [Ceratodon purpureus]|nr:hypothetical protein M758_11G126200 [Ceratodon purpureus]
MHNYLLRRSQTQPKNQENHTLNEWLPRPAPPQEQENNLHTTPQPSIPNSTKSKTFTTNPQVSAKSGTMTTPRKKNLPKLVLFSPRLLYLLPSLLSFSPLLLSSPSLSPSSCATKMVLVLSHNQSNS